jgi:hypothetical protein
MNKHYATITKAHFERTLETLEKLSETYKTEAITNPLVREYLMLGLIMAIRAHMIEGARMVEKIFKDGEDAAIDDDELMLSLYDASSAIKVCVTYIDGNVSMHVAISDLPAKLRSSIYYDRKKDIDAIGEIEPKLRAAIHDLEQIIRIIN